MALAEQRNLARFCFSKATSLDESHLRRTLPLTRNTKASIQDDTDMDESRGLFTQQLDNTGRGWKTNKSSMFVKDTWQRLNQSFNNRSSPLSFIKIGRSNIDSINNSDESSSSTENKMMLLEELDNLCDSMNSCSFAPGYAVGSLTQSKAATATLNASMGASWQFYNYVGDIGNAIPNKIIRNPNKAVVTMDARTSCILMANSIACMLFGYKENELVGMKMSKLLSQSRDQQQAMSEEILNTTGQVVFVNGKVMDALDSSGNIVPVSVWMKKMASSSDDDIRCITVMEPVERVTAAVLFDAEGNIYGGDSQFAVLHGYTNIDDLRGCNIRDLISSLNLPAPGSQLTKELKRQRATGRTKAGRNFPITIALKEENDETLLQEAQSFRKEYLKREIHQIDCLYQGVVWVFANISGLISFFADGTIHNCNEYFAKTLLGYTKEDLLSKNITKVVPRFYEYMNEDIVDYDGSLPLPPMDEDSGLSTPNVSTRAICGDSRVSELSDVSISSQTISEDSYVHNESVNRTDESDVAASTPIRMIAGKDGSPMRKEGISPVTDPNKIMEGCFVGFAKHKDQNFLGIIFQIKRVILDDNKVVFCAWIARDPDDLGECGRMAASMTLGSSFNNSFYVGALKEVSSRPASKMEDSTIDDQLSIGPYEKAYSTLDTIGKGAFGFVQLAERKSDMRKVVVKFIQKSKIFNDSWMKMENYGNVPLEVYLLSILNHPNIVRMIDVFENDDFYQVVMERHGSGMDLFEFIECRPDMDEALVSYLFRQMVAALSYLLSLNIVHRDIKDENIIINEKLNIKLIDFGSAAFVERGKLFATFCGTVEYCAPEVLLGNRYPGPELDMFALGVTLYTLVFGENPYLEPEETINGILRPPFMVTKDLFSVIAWLLHPSPLKRATIRDLEQNAWVNQPIDISDYSWDKIIHQEPTTHRTISSDGLGGIEEQDDNWDDSDSEQQLHQVLEKYLHENNEGNRLNFSF